ncbi:MAG: pyrroline-5-carboxylate reductase [Phycisphaerales bacterium]
MSHAPLAVIGGGAMAQAIIRGSLDAGTLHAADLLVLEPQADRRAVFEAWNVRTTAAPADLGAFLARAPDPGAILLAVKPQSLADVRAQCAQIWDGRRRVVISILAGGESALVRDALGPWAAVVRAMPNTAARVGRSTTGIALGAGARAGDEALAVRMFASIGIVIPIAEHLMDAFTAVAGSGPAYLYLLAEAMQRAATECGMSAGQADTAVRGTLAGAATLLARTTEAPATLRAAVTSKGGTTEAALDVLASAGVSDAFVRAIVAARDRGAALARGLT